MMHIKSIVLERYKPFRERCEIDIRPLTIFVGANNSGKSALARSIPLLAAGLVTDHSTAGSSPLPIFSHGLSHGNSFVDLISGRSVHGSLVLGAGFTSEERPVSLDARIQNIVVLGGPTSQVVDKWRLRTSDGQSIELVRRHLESNEYLVTETSKEGRETTRDQEIAWSGLLPNLGATDTPAAGDTPWHMQVQKELSYWARNIRYLRSPREPQESSFRVPARAPSALGVSGGEAFKLLATVEPLLDLVRKWFRDTFHVRLDIRQQGDFSVLEVSGDAWPSPVDISQTGQGLSHVLPVAILVMTARRAGSGVDILEHPEAELHPRIHADVADLIVMNLPGAVRPVVVETHSEVLLLRIRRHVAEGMLSPDNVAIYWIDRDEVSGDATARPVSITAGGEVTDWPEGIFQEDYEEVMAIRRAARSRGN